MWCVIGVHILEGFGGYNKTCFFASYIHRRTHARICIFFHHDSDSFAVFAFFLILCLDPPHRLLINASRLRCMNARTASACRIPNIKLDKDTVKRKVDLLKRKSSLLPASMMEWTLTWRTCMLRAVASRLRWGRQSLGICPWLDVTWMFFVGVGSAVPF